MRKDKIYYDDGGSNGRGDSCASNREAMELNAMKRAEMTALAEMGVTSEEYAAFLAEGKTVSDHRAELRSMLDEAEGRNTRHNGIKCKPALPDAREKSLRLKIQMKDVTKPPMWREIVIPADFNFSQLHHAIQAVTGLTNSHLWQFQEKAYDSAFTIGIPMHDDGFGLDDVTHDADETPLTSFLAAKGDKLEYVYDFGDDWIFTVSVLGVIDRAGEVAECTKWKCEFQPIEDSGGIWSYLQLRDAFSNADALTAKQKKELAASFCFDTFRQLSAWVDDAMMDIEYVNECLAELPESGRMEY